MLRKAEEQKLKEEAKNALNKKKNRKKKDEEDAKKAAEDKKKAEFVLPTAVSSSAVGYNLKKLVEARA